MNIIIITLIAGIIGSILYRLGGSGKGTLWRDIGCPLTALICLWVLQGVNFAFWWAYLLTFALGWGAMTTYWNFGKDVKWWNWILTGFFYGLSAFPLYWAGCHWWAIGIRTIVLAITIMISSELIGWDVLEEGGRGFLFTSSIILLMI